MIARQTLHRLDYGCPIGVPAADCRYALQRGAGKPGPQGRVVGEPLDRRAEGVDVSGRDDEPFDTIIEEIGGARIFSRDDGAAAGHRLSLNQRQALLNTGKNQNVRLTEHVLEVALWHVAHGPCRWIVVQELAHGWMPWATRAVLDDYGLSYGCVCCLFALLARVPGWWRLPYAVLLGALLAELGVAAAPQDYTATGHLVAALLGGLVAVLLAVRGRSAPAGRTA